MGNSMVLELLRKRHSARAFQERPLEPKILNDMLEAARLSPSGGNEQAWQFGVIADPSVISKVAEASYQQRWIASAPLLIVLCTQMVQDENHGRDIQIQRFPEHTDSIVSMEKALYSALNSEEHQTKIPAAHMALVALEHGIGCTWISRFEVGKVAHIIDVPAGFFPTEMLVFGYSTKQGKPKEKKPLDELVLRRVSSPF